MTVGTGRPVYGQEENYGALQGLCANQTATECSWRKQVISFTVHKLL